MPSSIDPTKPADGVPAVKADLRANLQAAKDEIEALQVAITGSARIVNVMNYAGVRNDDTNHSATLAGINSAIAAANGDSDPKHLNLYFPAGRYGIDAALTPADGDYSIMMAPGALIRHHGSKNEVVWRIGSPTVQNDGEGFIRFELAMEGRGPNNYDNAENVAFEIVNIKHYSAFVRAAYKFVTGLRLIADDAFHHYDAFKVSSSRPCVRWLRPRSSRRGRSSQAPFKGTFRAASPIRPGMVSGSARALPSADRRGSVRQCRERGASAAARGRHTSG